MTQRWIDVAAGAILNDAGTEVLLAKRRADQHQGNLWEFPGGKLEPEERAKDALSRELQEEIGITPTSVDELIVVEHNYGDKAVRLYVFTIKSFSGEPKGLEGQVLQWVPLIGLHQFEFPAANVPIVQALLAGPSEQPLVFLT